MIWKSLSLQVVGDGVTCGSVESGVGSGVTSVGDGVGTGVMIATMGDDVGDRVGAGVTCDGVGFLEGLTVGEIVLQISSY